MNSGDYWTNSADSWSQPGQQASETRPHPLRSRPSRACTRPAAAAGEKFTARGQFIRARMNQGADESGDNSGCADLEFLDHRIGEQLGRQLGDLRHRRLVRRAADLQLESLALADAGDLPESQALAGARDRLALRVMDLRLEHHVDDDSGHVTQRTRPGSGSAGRMATARSAGDGRDLLADLEP